MANRLVAVMLLATAGLGAEGTTPVRPAKRRWWVSVAAVAAASVVDVHSSWSRPELNPMLQGPDGRFRVHGVAIKSSIVGASCGLQWLLLRRKPQLSNTLAGVNAGLAAWTGAVAVRNLTR